MVAGNVFLISLCCLSTIVGGIRTPDPDFSRNATELIRSRGYPWEEHRVTTMDGYLILLHRIPCGRNRRWCDLAKRPPVLLQHGILETSDVWLLNGPSRSLGFILADAGYDVWLGNVRGNRYGRRHLWKDPQHFTFWDFTFEEMGVLDLRATVDSILERTRGHPKLYFVGFSMGASMVYTLLSEIPDFNGKFRMLVLFSPVTSCADMRSPVASLASWFLSRQFLQDPSAHGEFLSQSSFPAELCGHPLLALVCVKVYSLFNGFNPFNLDKSRLDVYFAHFPAGVSRKTISHYAQSYYSRAFRKYDYGRKSNLKLYGQPRPPDYKLSHVRVPTVIFWGENDLANSPGNIFNSSFYLSNLVSIIRVPDSNWGHMDFDNGLHANRLVYGKVMDLMSRF